MDGFAVVVIVAAVVFIASAVAFFLHYRKNQQEKKFECFSMKKAKFFKIGFDVKKASAYVVEAQDMSMSMQSLQKATNNFSNDNILGRGGFGVVYKGDHNGVPIAVKRNNYDLMGKRGQEQFRAEIEMLQKVRNRHLVAILGYCDDGQERLLVYEYMLGDTLGQHLFGWERRQETPLTWRQKLVIALDVARGIEYLHSLELHPQRSEAF